MTMTYVFPDLHGRFDHLVRAIEAMNDDGGTTEDTLVFLGDYIDRGPESNKVVSALRALQDARERVICLSGNHEYMMIWGLTEGEEQLKGWMRNGGTTTVESYTDALGELDEATMMEDCRWFASLPLFYEDEHRVYVHAGVEPSQPLGEHLIKTLHWKIYETLDGMGYNGKHVVHGHEADKIGPKTIGHRTALDVGAVWTGRYVVGVFDDTVAGGPVRVLEVLV